MRGEPPGAFFAQDEQLVANGLAVEAEHGWWGRYQRWGPLVTFSDTQPRYGPGVLAGEHTDAILRGVGLDETAIGELRRAGVVDSAAPMEI